MTFEAPPTLDDAQACALFFPFHVGWLALHERGLYTAWMFVAATGYAVFTPALFLKADPERARVAFGLRYRALHVCYAALLLGSILWMPLTKWHLDGALPFVWRIAAPLGAGAFCVETVILDALVWPALW
jgi:hypothetical protein